MAQMPLTVCGIFAMLLGFVANSGEEKPEIHFPGPAVRAMRGLWLKCSARGTPPIQVTIHRNGTQLVKKTGFAEVRIEDEGEYRCTAGNEAETDSKETFVSFPTNCDSKCYGQGGFTGEVETRGVNYYSCSYSSSYNDIFRCAPTIATRIELRYIEIRELPADSFKNMDSLQILDLTGNKIDQIPTDVFSDLKELRELNLGSNRLQRLPKDIFKNLSTLQKLDSSFNSIEELYNETFMNLWSLLRLDLSWNKIDQIPSDIFSDLKKLRELDLSWNKIDQIPSDMFSDLKELRKLMLQHNKIVDLPVGTFGALYNLQILDLSWNKIDQIPSDVFSDLKELRKLWLYSNKIVDLPVGTFGALYNLQILDLAYNQLLRLPKNIFNNLSTLQQLWLYSNNIVDLPLGTFGALYNLQILDLSGNKIDQIPSHLFSDLKELRKLSLHRNLVDSITNETFANLTELEFLFLNDNRLTKIPDEAFLNLKNLGLLMLSNNEIKDVGSKAFFVGNSIGTIIYMLRTALKSFDLDSLEIVDSATTKISMSDGQISSVTLKNKNGSMLCKIQLGVGNSDEEYLDLPFQTLLSFFLRRSLQQSGFTKMGTKYLPCPTGTFVNASSKDRPSCERCPPGGYFSDSLAFVSEQGCKRCPNGTYVSLDNSPGTHALNCTACPQGTDTDSFAGFLACKCLNGFHRFHMFEACHRCDKEGWKCENDHVTLEKGYWWKWYNDSVKGLYKNYTLNLLSSNPSFDSNIVEYPFPLPMPHECPRNESCLGGFDAECNTGCEGPLCEVCSHGYYKRFQTCTKCPTKAWMAGQLTITFVLLLLLVVIVVWTSIKKRNENRERALVDIILARLKIVIGFYQVTFGLLDAFTFIKWPDSLAAIAKYSEMLQLNVLQIAPIHCLFPQFKVDAFGSLFAILAINAAAVAVAGTSYGIKRLLIISKSRHLENDAEAKQISKSKELIYKNLFFFLFVTYLTTCSKTANVLPVACREICHDDDGKVCFKYLKADFTVECHSLRNKHLVSVAYFAIAYIVFLPLASYLFLWKQNRKVKASENDTGQKQTFGKELAAGMRFLSENYTARSWYWELVETVRKVILTSGLILVGGESRAYVGFACVISGLYGMFFAYVRPVKDPFENKLMLTSLAVTFVNLGIGAVSKIPKENIPASIDPYVDSVMFNILVISANTLVIGLFVVQYSVYLYQFMKEWRKNPRWSISCCLAMLLPLNDLQGEIRGMMGRNVLRQRFQSGRISMPSVTGAVKDTGVIDFQLEEEETTEDTPESLGGQNVRSHSPQIVRDPSDPCITDFVVSPLVVHYRPNRRETSL